jgi:hypothetical protein
MPCDVAQLADERLARFKRVVSGRINRAAWCRSAPPDGLRRCKSPTSAAALLPNERARLRIVQLELFMEGEGDERIPFDKRIDEIGYAQELAGAFTKDRRTAVKVMMLGKQVTRATANCFEAVLVESDGDRVVDPSELLKLYTKNKITRDQLVGVLSASASKCEKFLSKDQIDAISERKEKEPYVKVTRIKTAAETIVERIKRLAAAITS